MHEIDSMQSTAFSRTSSDEFPVAPSTSGTWHSFPIRRPYRRTHRGVLEVTAKPKWACLRYYIDTIIR